jgi:hypothetical protein
MVSSQQKNMLEGKRNSLVGSSLGNFVPLPLKTQKDNLEEAHSDYVL